MLAPGQDLAHAAERHPREFQVNAWPTVDEMTLQNLAGTYGRYYDLWFDGGTYYARYALDGEPLKADSPEGLDSAIRADLWRRGAR